MSSQPSESAPMEANPATEPSAAAPSHRRTGRRGAIAGVDLHDATEFFDAAKAAFEAAADKRKAYPKIEASFRLGWHMTELLLEAGKIPDPDAPAKEEPPAPTDRLPSARTLDPATRIEVLVAQIGVDVKEIAAAAAIPPAQMPVKLGDLASAAPADRATTILAMHGNMLSTLTATDFRLGKAYSLGVGLADIALRPDAASFAPDRVEELCGNVDDLKDTFAMHASHAVRTTLCAWAALAKVNGGAVPATAVDALAQEGRIWRALLSGEKAPRELLTNEDYVVAVQQVGKNAARTARHVVRRLWLEAAAALLVFAGLVTVLVVYTHGDARGLVGFATILGAVGISWKSIGTVLGKSFEKLEAEAWDAEIGERVAARAFTLPPE